VTQADGTTVVTGIMNDGCYWNNVLVYTLLRDFVDPHVEVHATVEADDREFGGWYENMYFMCANERNGVSYYVYRPRVFMYRPHDDWDPLHHRWLGGP
jgi:hypothetical protein